MNKQNSLSRALSIPGLDDKCLDEAMEILWAHQKTCQKTGKYMQADLVKKRLAKMKVDLQKQRKLEMAERFESQRKQVQTAHLEEMTEFNSFWDGKFMEYQAEAEGIQNNMFEKHQAETQEFHQVVEQSIPMAKRETSQIINLKKVEEQLARKEEYVQAHKIQKQISDIQRKEGEKWAVMRGNKVRNLMAQLVSKQEIELGALRQKIQQGFEEQKKLRQTEEQKLMQKFQNFMKQLQNKHNQQIIRLQKNFKLQSTMNFSRSQASSRVLQSRNY